MLTLNIYCIEKSYKHQLNKINVLGLAGYQHNEVTIFKTLQHFDVYNNERAGN